MAYDLEKCFLRVPTSDHDGMHVADSMRPQYTTVRNSKCRQDKTVPGSTMSDRRAKHQFTCRTASPVTDACGSHLIVETERHELLLG